MCILSYNNCCYYRKGSFRMSFPLNLKDRGTEFISLDPKNCPNLPVEDNDSLEFLDLCY
jgi:hypothetical protein